MIPLTEQNCRLSEALLHMNCNNAGTLHWTSSRIKAMLHMLPFPQYPAIYTGFSRYTSAGR